MQSLKTFRNKAPGLPDLLNYAAMIDEGIIIGKDGCLMAGFFYRGHDIASSTAKERNAISARLNAALARLGSGWMTHHDVIRMPSREYPAPINNHFPDPITKLIDEERRKQFNHEDLHYESVYALSVTYLPPMGVRNKVSDLFFDSDGEKKSLGSRNLEFFKNKLAELVADLSTVMHIQQMTTHQYVQEDGRPYFVDELLGFLNYIICGTNHQMRLPECPMYLDSILGGYELWTGVTPKIEDNFIYALAIDGFPQESFPGILSILDQLPIQYRWSNRFIYMDAVESISHLKKYRRKWEQQVRGFMEQVFHTQNGPINQDALAMVHEIEDAISQASSNLVGYGYYTSVVILSGSCHEKLEENIKKLRMSIQNLGFSCRVETVNTMEAWLGSLPGHGKENVRRPLMHTLNLADLLPIAGIWPGEEFCPCPMYPDKSPALFHAATQGATPFRVNLHCKDVGHTLIIGPTGAGKSTLLAFIAAQFRRYPNASIFAFDKGNSMQVLVDACNGMHYNIGDEGDTIAFCPLLNISGRAEQAWYEQWIEMLLGLQGVQVSPSMRNSIHKAMSLVRGACAGKTLSDFVTNIQDQEVKEALAYYTIDGPMGHLLDSDTDGLELSSFQVFEIEHLMNLGEKATLPVITYLFHKIEQQLKGQPALLILDEAWLMLGHPVFREKIREWVKVLRKSNCAVVMATQSISDAARSGIMDVLQESCPTKILLPNIEATNSGSDNNPGPRELYQLFGLNDAQIAIIATSIPKRHYYLVSPQGRRLFELNLGDIAKSFVAVSDKSDLKFIAALKAKYKEKWVWHWLDHKGVNYKI